MLGESRKSYSFDWDSDPKNPCSLELQKRECERVSLFGLSIRHCWILVIQSSNLKDYSKKTTDIVINTLE